jgi:hypothetical protein
MKTTATILLAILCLVNSSSAQANDEKYLQAMQKNIQAVYEGKTIADIQMAVNAFERIGSAETTRWEPHYYAAFGYLMMCNRETEGGKKDAYIDRALQAIEKAKELKPSDSEIIALEGFALMMRVTVDPASRGAQFSMLSVKAFQQAIELDPQNPRALMLLAQMQYGTAEFFGSSPTEACETLSASLAKFESFTSENVLAPRWGKAMAMGLKEKCK